MPTKSVDKFVKKWSPSRTEGLSCLASEQIGQILTACNPPHEINGLTIRAQPHWIASVSSPTPRRAVRMHVYNRLVKPAPGRAEGIAQDPDHPGAATGSNPAGGHPRCVPWTERGRCRGGLHSSVKRPSIARRSESMLSIALPNGAQTMEFDIAGYRRGRLARPEAARCRSVNR